MASWLVHFSLDRVVWVQALSREIFDYSFCLYCVLFLLYDNCIVSLYISYLDLVVGPHQLYSCFFKPTYQINVCMYVCAVFLGKTLNFNSASLSPGA